MLNMLVFILKRFEQSLKAKEKRCDEVLNMADLSAAILVSVG